MSLLKGVRILDMTRVLAGPFATMILGDMGADIIKIENPNGGDETRTWGPPYIDSESTYFMSINRNKRGIAVDIQKPKGIKILHKLAAVSDVFIENYIPGKLDKYKLGYKDISKLNEKIIYCSVTGYGQDGPYATRAGYDVIAASVGGLLHITGPVDGDPCRVGVAMTDLSTGLYAHGAILAALLEKQKTGRGQHICCNLLSTQVAILSHIASAYLNAGVEAKRWGTGHANIVPYQAFKTKDEIFITIGAGNNHQFANLCKILEIDDLLLDDRYKDNHSRVINRKDLLEIIQDKFLEKTAEEWLRKLEGCGFPYGPINSIENVFNDPQVLHNNCIQEIHHTSLNKSVKVSGPAVEFSEHSYDNPRPPPTLGQHTTEILRDVLQVNSEEINNLYKEGIVV